MRSIETNRSLNSKKSEEEETRSPLRYIIAGFLIIILILWLVPYYWVGWNPSPKRIPTIDEIGGDVIFEGKTVKYGNDYRFLVNSTDPYIKTIAHRVISISCPKSNEICHAKALYYFVRDNFNYISDPKSSEYIEEARLFYAGRGGDCESGSIFLANLLESIGIKTEFVIIPRHALIKAYLPQAKTYAQGDWVYMDWTCGNCDFGEISYQVIKFVEE